MKVFDKLDDRYRFVRRSRQLLMALLDAVGFWMLGLLRRGRPIDLPEKSEVRRLLLIQLDHLGDAVMTTAMLPALHANFSGAKIDVLAAPWNWEVFAGSPNVGRIWLSRNNRFRRGMPWLWPLGFAYWSWRLRRERYDLAIDVRGDFVHAALMLAAGIPQRIGWSSSGGGFLLTKSATFERGRHEVSSRLALLQALGIEPSFRDVPVWRPSPDAEVFISHMLGAFQRSEKPLVVMHVGAGTRAKVWPVEHWRELLGRVIVELDARVILVGSAADRDTAAEVTQAMFWPGVMDWTGRLSVDQLAALARRCDAYVGADSGPAHVAAATGARVIVLFSGANSPQQWRPFGDRVTVLAQAVACSPCYRNDCPLQHHACMRDLAPGRVVAALDSLLNGEPVLAGPHFLKFQPQSHRRESDS